MNIQYTIILCLLFMPSILKQLIILNHNNYVSDWVKIIS